jgi:hypothetical protein
MVIEFFECETCGTQHLGRDGAEACEASPHEIECMCDLRCSPMEPSCLCACHELERRAERLFPSGNLDGAP